VTTPAESLAVAAYLAVGLYAGGGYLWEVYREDDEPLPLWVHPMRVAVAALFVVLAPIIWIYEIARTASGR